MDFIEEPQKPSVYISGSISLTKEQFMPIALQFFQLKNWLVQLSSENQNLDADAQLRLMQFDLNLFKVTR